MRVKKRLGLRNMVGAVSGKQHGRIDFPDHVGIVFTNCLDSAFMADLLYAFLLSGLAPNMRDLRVNDAGLIYERSKFFGVKTLCADETDFQHLTSSFLYSSGLHKTPCSPVFNSASSHVQAPTGFQA